MNQNTHTNLFQRLKAAIFYGTSPEPGKRSGTFTGFVKYQWHIPGFSNFHLLPFSHRQQGNLNIFKPYWNRHQQKNLQGSPSQIK